MGNWKEHSRKPDELYNIVEACSKGPYLELFALGTRPGWTGWGNQAEQYEITWDTYADNSQAKRKMTDEPVGRRLPGLLAAE